MVAESDPIRSWGEAVATLLVDTGDVADEAEGWQLAGRLMAGAHLTTLDGMVPLPDDGQLGRAWVVDWLAGRLHLWEQLRELSREELAGQSVHLEAVEAFSFLPGMPQLKQGVARLPELHYCGRLHGANNGAVHPPVRDNAFALNCGGPCLHHEQG